MMAFEADRMTGLVLKDENVLPERDVVLEEYNMRVANNPDARLTEQAMAALYLNHPYGRPVIGWHHEIEKLTREDALAFYKRFYAPNNATLVIAGDVDAQEIRPRSKRPSARCRRSPPFRRLASVRRNRCRSRRGRSRLPILASNNPSCDAIISRLRTTAAAAKPGAGCARAIDWRRQQLLSLPRAGRRQAARRQRQRLLSGHRARSDPFSIAAAPKPGVSFAEVEQAIDAVIANLTTNPSPPRTSNGEEPVDRAGDLRQDNQATLARWYGAAVTVGLSVDDIRNWPDRIRAVTAAQVRDAAQKWLSRTQSVTGYLIKDTTPKREEKGREINPNRRGAPHPSPPMLRIDLLRHQSFVRSAKIQHLVTPGGIEAWFVQDATVPLVAMEYAFAGGATQDPADKPGVATWSPACSTKAPAISTPRPSMNGSTAAP